jgi:hypothetical protein
VVPDISVEPPAAVRSALNGLRKCGRAIILERKEGGMMVCGLVELRLPPYGSLRRLQLSFSLFAGPDRKPAGQHSTLVTAGCGEFGLG